MKLRISINPFGIALIVLGVISWYFWFSVVVSSIFNLGTAVDGGLWGTVIVNIIIVLVGFFIWLPINVLIIIFALLGVLTLLDS